MQLAVSGTYAQGHITLHELPPIEQPTEVMVVFLSGQSVSEVKPTAKMACLHGIARSASAEVVDFAQLEQELSQLSAHTAEVWQQRQQTWTD